MLNISPHNRVETSEIDCCTTLQQVEEAAIGTRMVRFLLILFALLLGLLFLPWTQNIRAKGYVTTIYPDQRPQEVMSIIPGKVEKWFVREGDFVKKGDTLVFLSEVKDDYFDPQLIDRTASQISAKNQSAQAYSDKVGALDGQIAALQSARLVKLQQARLKIQQNRLKVTSDSADLVAVRIDQQVADTQYVRMEGLYERGLKSLTDLEKRRLKLQETQAKRIAQENKLLAARNDLLTAQMELDAIENDYREKVAKAQSDLQSARSSQFDTEATVQKMENQLSNYKARQANYYITAPQTGYVTQAITRGIGEVIKDGEAVVTIMPNDPELAVEMYVRPLDLPLLHIGSGVRVQFDGWPAIIFSGWPNVSYGTYGAEVIAIDRFADTKGQYRVLLRPDPDDHLWPDALRVGSGANTIALLNDVPIWYELWRQLNGFPPDYYTEKAAVEAKKK